ncbi:hypothetical protein PALA9_05717 [Pseudomonas aeruginosa]|nr:hypothetical protein PALA9_05717 [Pseudomonas aeruginosa]
MRATTRSARKRAPPTRASTWRSPRPATTPCCCTPQACYARNDQVSAEEGAADARFHLAIAEASHNTVLLHTIKGLFDLLRRNVVTNIGGMYAQRTETRAQLMEQHQRLYDAIISGQAELAREVSNQHIHYVQEVLAEVQEEARRMKRSQRRRSVQED